MNIGDERKYLKLFNYIYETEKKNHFNWEKGLKARQNLNLQNFVYLEIAALNFLTDVCSNKTDRQFKWVRTRSCITKSHSILKILKFALMSEREEIETKTMHHEWMNFVTKFQ